MRCACCVSTPPMSDVFPLTPLPSGSACTCRRAEETRTYCIRILVPAIPYSLPSLLFPGPGCGVYDFTPQLPRTHARKPAGLRGMRGGERHPRPCPLPLAPVHE